MGFIHHQSFELISKKKSYKLIIKASSLSGGQSGLPAKHSFLAGGADQC